MEPFRISQNSILLKHVQYASVSLWTCSLSANMFFILPAWKNGLKGTRFAHYVLGILQVKKWDYTVLNASLPIGKQISMKLSQIISFMNAKYVKNREIYLGVEY